MKIFLIFFLLFALGVSVFANLSLYFLEENCRSEKQYYEMDNKTKEVQLMFLIDLISSGEVKVDRPMFLSYLTKNEIPHKEKNENNYFYVTFEYLTVRFDAKGDLLSVAPDK